MCPVSSRLLDTSELGIEGNYPGFDSKNVNTVFVQYKFEDCRYAVLSLFC
jgi:hypothetical protein